MLLLKTAILQVKRTFKSLTFGISTVFFFLKVGCITVSVTKFK